VESGERKAESGKRNAESGNPPRITPGPPVPQSPSRKGRAGKGDTGTPSSGPAASSSPVASWTSHDLRVHILDSTPDGGRIIRIDTPGSPREAIERHGHVPLPPYIGREPDEHDRERYQTVYAETPGSVAAPTAGLHFTPALLDTLEARGVHVVRTVLHVGVGTFRPVEAEDPAEHAMHAEWYGVPEGSAERMNAVRAAGGRIWAVGTTVARTLETAGSEAGRVAPGNGWTDLFIRPPYRFRVVDRLVTNFHLPRSTLLMLVAAFGGYELVMRAYEEAVASGYRFYSYGDAMVLI